MSGHSKWSEIRRRKGAPDLEPRVVGMTAPSAEALMAAIEEHTPEVDGYCDDGSSIRQGCVCGWGHWESVAYPTWAEHVVAAAVGLDAANDAVKQPAEGADRA